MEILTKQFTLDKPKSVTVEYIESYIKESGYTPLRWAIVKSGNNKLIVDTVVILD